MYNLDCKDMIKWADIWEFYFAKSHVHKLALHPVKEK